MSQCFMNVLVVKPVLNLKVRVCHEIKKGIANFYTAVGIDWI